MLDLARIRRHVKISDVWWPSEIVSDDFPVLHRHDLLLIIHNRLRCGLAQFELCAHFLEARAERFNLLLLPCNRRPLLLHRLVLFEKLVQN